MIQTILFATDMGLHTHYLLHHVNSLAEQYDARVIVVHVMEPPGHLGDAMVQSYLSDDSRKEFKQEGISRIIDGVKGRIVDVLEEEFIDGQQGLSKIRDVRVIPGKPVEVILREAAECSADMIILGSHGVDTTTPNMLGSVTSRILQMSRVPVYMVPLIRNFMAKAAVG
ncbi:universal stress protein [Oceanicoccus sp. KOV_DT_Chl]|uniref:universal stress protein n=1 Tax=Oceanicoccus sp. KOV_DT_Chl TaxID=1904639 RepID=UPI0011AED437|nr:universal stress protein [Oceanicoccus sp. KOV_DT_Chl]